MSLKSHTASDANLVRRTYEERPYPTVDDRVLRDTLWRLAPMEWINALWKPGCETSTPKRILIAGCGTGREAFQMSRRFPEAQIVAIDFSPRSISIARKLQKRAREMRNVRFIVADLANRGLAKALGQGFDFVSCHGVLSYVSAPERALRNLARCLKPTGALYLGVNGARHFSEHWREILPTFGFDPHDFHDSRRLRTVLRACDAMSFHESAFRISTKPATYLAGDLFGSIIHNLPLSEWLPMARAAGLSLRGSASCGHALRPLCDKDLTRVLMPRSRAEVCELEELLIPSTFHRLLFTRQPVANPPWDSFEKLLDWRPTLTQLHNIALPVRGRSGHALRIVKCTSTAMGTRIELRIPEWEVEILRDGNGVRSLRDIIGKILDRIPASQLREQLYLLYLLVIIDLLPPVNSVTNNLT